MKNILAIEVPTNTTIMLFRNLYFGAPWDAEHNPIALNLSNSDDTVRSQISIPDAIRLRDWLAEAIAAAGPAPLHPDIEKLVPRASSAMATRGWNDLRQRVSDRLYKLDQIEQSETA